MTGEHTEEGTDRMTHRVTGGHTEKHTPRGKGHVNMEAEIGVRLTQTKEYQEPQELEEARKDSLPRNFGESRAL